MADRQSPARRRLLQLISLAVVLVVLAGGIWVLNRSSSSPLFGQSSRPPASLTATNAPAATPAAQPAHVVYTANWLHGSGGWTLPSSVQVKGGTLVFSGNGNANLTIPFQAPVSGFSISINMEIDVVNPAARGGTITIAGQDASGVSQYYAQLLCVGYKPGCGGGQFTVGVEGGQYPNGMEVSDFDVGPYPTPYQVRVGPSNVQFCFQGSCESAAYIHAPKTPLTLVIQDDYLEMKVTSMSISYP